jgi:excinuclease ABC subunit C
MLAADHIRKKLGTLPHKPGIYLMRDRFGTVIYVGKARDLRKRVSHYFQPSRRLGWDLKFKALTDAIHDFDFHVVRSEPEALLLEGKLIKEFHPRYNISFRDDKQFLMLKVNLNRSRGSRSRALSRTMAPGISGHSRIRARCAARWPWCDASIICAAADR